MQGPEVRSREHVQTRPLAQGLQCLEARSWEQRWWEAQMHFVALHVVSRPQSLHCKWVALAIFMPHMVSWSQSSCRMGVAVGVVAPRGCCCPYAACGVVGESVVTGPQKRRSVEIRNRKTYRQVDCRHKEHSDVCVQPRWAWRCDVCSHEWDGDAVRAVAGAQRHRHDSCSGRGGACGCRDTARWGHVSGVVVSSGA